MRLLINVSIIVSMLIIINIIINIINNISCDLYSTNSTVFLKL